MNQQAATATRRDKLTSGQRQRPIEWRRGSRSGTILNGGTLEVASGGSTGSGAVTFSGGGTLMLDDSLQFGGLVAGFGVPDRIGLADFPFLAGTLYRRVNADVRQRFSAVEGAADAPPALAGQPPMDPMRPKSRIKIPHCRRPDDPLRRGHQI